MVGNYVTRVICFVIIIQVYVYSEKNSATTHTKCMCPFIYEVRPQKNECISLNLFIIAKPCCCDYDICFFVLCIWFIFVFYNDIYCIKIFNVKKGIHNCCMHLTLQQLTYCHGLLLIRYLLLVQYLPIKAFSTKEYFSL